MNRTLASIASVAVATVASGGLFLGLAGSASATTAPPWEPDGNSVGGLLFFDSSGAQVSGGSVSDPVAAYVQGANPIRSGDTKAVLYGYTPVAGAAPGAWQGELLSSATAYPNSAAPSTVSTTLPVVTHSSTDSTIADLVSHEPNTDTSTTDGYAGLYQLRLETSAPFEQGNTTYDSADIKVTGSGSTATWSVAFDKTASSTTTSLTVTPKSPAIHGKSVKLAASVSPSTAVGSVSFFDGTKLLKKVTVSGGKASYSTTTLSDATHKLKATFAPTSTTAFDQSSSTTKSLKVEAQPTKTALKVSAKSVKKGKKLTLTATEKPAVAGKVVFYDGSKKLASVNVKAGKATYSTKKLKKGTHALKVTFTPSSTTADAASTSSKIKVKVTA